MRKADCGLIINTSSVAGWVSAPYFGTYSVTKFALEAYSQCLRYEVARFGVDIALVEPGPFSTGLFVAMKPPACSDVLESYGELKDVQTALLERFGELLENNVADLKYVVDAYLKLSETRAGKHPMLTQVGVTWGADAINKLTQPIQDKVIEGM